MPQTSTFIVPMLGLHLFSSVFLSLRPLGAPLGGCAQGGWLAQALCGLSPLELMLKASKVCFSCSGLHGGISRFRV